MEPDKQIQSLQQDGNLQRALFIIFNQYGSELYGFIINCIGDIDAADEIYSDMSEDVCRGLLNFQWRSSLRTWLYALTRNSLYRYKLNLMHRKNRFVPLSRAPISDLICPNNRTSTADYQKTHNKLHARQIRKKLPLDDQMLLILKIDRNLSWQEIVQIMLDKSSSEVIPGKYFEQRLRKRFQRIKHKFRQLAIQEGLIEDIDCE